MVTTNPNLPRWIQHTIAHLTYGDALAKRETGETPPYNALTEAQRAAPTKRLHSLLACFASIDFASIDSQRSLSAFIEQAHDWLLEQDGFRIDKSEGPGEMIVPEDRDAQASMVLLLTISSKIIYFRTAREEATQVSRQAVEHEAALYRPAIEASSSLQTADYSAALCCHLGFLLAILKKYELATTTLKQAIEFSCQAPNRICVAVAKSRGQDVLSCLIKQAKRHTWRVRADAYRHLGNIFRRQSHWKRAAKNYSQAIIWVDRIGIEEKGVQEQQAQTYYNRGVVHNQQSRFSAAESDYSKALYLYKEAFDIPGRAKAYFNRGVVRRKQGNFSEAEADFSKAVILFDEVGNAPMRVKAYDSRGNARSEQGDLLGAISDYSEAITLFKEANDIPGRAKAHYNRGNARSEQGDLPGAEADFSKVISLRKQTGNTSGRAKAHYDRGLARKKQGNLPGAEADFSEAIALRKQTDETNALAHAYNDRGCIRIEQGDLARSEADLSEAISLWEETGNAQSLAGAHRNRGLVHEKHSDLSCAEADYSRAISLFRQAGDTQKLAESYLARGNTRNEQGDFAGAEADYSETIPLLDPTDDSENLAAAHNNRGLIRLSKGDSPGAASDYSIAIPLLNKTGDTEGLAHAHHARGYARNEQGDLSGAEADFSETITLRKQTGDVRGLASAYGSRGRIRATQENLEEARKDVEACLSLVDELLNSSSDDVASDDAAPTDDANPNAPGYGGPAPPQPVDRSTRSLKAKAHDTKARALLMSVGTVPARPKEALQSAQIALRIYRSMDAALDDFLNTHAGAPSSQASSSQAPSDGFHEHDADPKGVHSGNGYAIDGARVLDVCGIAHLNCGNAGRAIKDFSSGIALCRATQQQATMSSSLQIELHVHRGLAYLQGARIEHAADDFETVIDFLDTLRGGMNHLGGRTALLQAHQSVYRLLAATRLCQENRMRRHYSEEARAFALRAWHAIERGHGRGLLDLLGTDDTLQALDSTLYNELQMVRQTIQALSSPGSGWSDIADVGTSLKEGLNRARQETMAHMKTEAPSVSDQEDAQDASTRQEQLRAAKAKEEALLQKLVRKLGPDVVDVPDVKTLYEGLQQLCSSSRKRPGCAGNTADEQPGNSNKPAGLLQLTDMPRSFPAELSRKMATSASLERVAAFTATPDYVLLFAVDLSPSRSSTVLSQGLSGNAPSDDLRRSEENPHGFDAADLEAARDVPLTTSVVAVPPGSLQRWQQLRTWIDRLLTGLWLPEKASGESDFSSGPAYRPAGYSISLGHQEATHDLPKLILGALSGTGPTQSKGILHSIEHGSSERECKSPGAASPLAVQLATWHACYYASPKQRHATAQSLLRMLLKEMGTYLGPALATHTGSKKERSKKEQNEKEAPSAVSDSDPGVRMPDYDVLWLSLGGALSDLPLHAIPLPSTGKRLFQMGPTAYLGSAATGARLSQALPSHPTDDAVLDDDSTSDRALAGSQDTPQDASQDTPAVLLMGPPQRDLRAARKETANARRVWRTKAQTYWLNDMTVEHLKTEGSQSRFINLATHSVFRSGPRYPESYIAFHDERLRLADLVTDPTLSFPQARLVRLGSCQSARSRSGVGQLQGLIWAVMASGATAVEGTLWTVPDRIASEYGTQFHMRLQKMSDASLAAAYQETLCRMHDDQPDNPLAWATFALFGSVAQPM